MVTLIFLRGLCGYVWVNILSLLEKMRSVKEKTSTSSDSKRNVLLVQRDYPAAILMEAMPMLLSHLADHHHYFSLTGSSNLSCQIMCLLWQVILSCCKRPLSKHHLFGWHIKVHGEETVGKEGMEGGREGRGGGRGGGGEGGGGGGLRLKLNVVYNDTW